MENAPICDITLKRQGYVLELMQKLLDCTRQLGHCEESAHMEIAPATEACERHLLALQQALAIRGKHEGATPTLRQFLGHNSKQSEDLREMLQSLVAQTDHCIEWLGRQLEGTARELASLRSSQTAIRAYRGR
jgi:hypothetical protein